MTAQLRNCRPYSSGYDKDGRYYEQWIEDDEDDDVYDFRDEQSFVATDTNDYTRVKNKIDATD